VELDLDAGLFAVTLHERLDPQHDPSDQLVQRAGRTRNPGLGH
jgi:hypothetical protein